MYKKNQQYSERVNALILQIQSLSYQKNTKISDISNLNVELKRIEYETLQGISDKNIRTIVQSIAKEFSSLCEQIATKKSKNKISLFTKIIDNSQNSKNIKTSDIQAELNQMAEVLKQHRNNIDKALEISQRTNTDEKKSDKEMTVKLKAKDLKLFPTKESSNPKHEELLHELGAQKACYANYQGATGGGSSFICAEDDKSIYMMTNKHVAFNYNKENGEIIGTNDIKALEFEENSGITLIKTKNIQSFASNNVDMAILKIPKKDFKITKKLYIPKFSPDLIKNGELVISMGNSYGDGNVMAFGSVINNKEKMKDNISGNRINNFIGSKITSYPGNSGCPLFHCNATEDKDGKMRFDEFQIVGLNSKGSASATKDLHQAKSIEGRTKYDEKFDELKDKYFKQKIDVLYFKGYNRRELDAYKMNLANEFDRLGNKEQDKLIGFDEEKYAPLNYEFAEIFAFAISSKDIITEIEAMKYEYTELKNLKLKVAPSRESKIDSISEQYKDQENELLN